MSDDETPITSVRFPREQIAEIDEMVDEEFPDRSTAIRHATGKKLYGFRQESGRADAVDGIVGAYWFEETAPDLHAAVEDALAAVEPERTDAAVTVRGTTRYGDDAFYGAGEDIPAATADLIDTVYGAAVERAVKMYGLPVQQ